MITDHNILWGTSYSYKVLWEEVFLKNDNEVLEAR